MFGYFELPLRKKHSEQAQKQEKPANEGDQHRPATNPELVCANDCKPGDEKRNTNKMNTGSSIASPDMNIHRFGGRDLNDSGAKQSCDIY